MLNIFRKRQTLVRAMLGVILFLVCAAMVITLIPGLTGDIDTANNPVVAEVEGDRITQLELQQSVREVSTRNRIPSEMVPLYTGQILNSMIVEKASLREAERMGLRVEEQELLAQLRQDPNFFPNGNFVGQQQYEDMVSSRLGLTVGQFEDRYRKTMLLDKLRQIVTDHVAVTPEEIHKTFVGENDKIALDYVAVNPADYLKDINPSDSALEEYYQKNTGRYQVPEKRSGKALFLKRDALRQGFKASDDDIKKYYQDHLDTYRVKEEVTVRHILIKADPKNQADLDRAKKKAEDLIKKLQGGADFIKLAKENSDDKSNSDVGGILSNIGRGQTVPEFEKVAFSLKTDELSGPVQTMYGIHIIKGISHQLAHLQSLEEVRSSLVQVVLDAKVNQLLDELTDRAAKELDHAPADIQAIAEKNHAEVVPISMVVQNQEVPGIAVSTGLSAALFSMDKNHAAGPVKVQDGYTIPVLLDISPAHQGVLSEAKDQVKKDYSEEQAKTKAIAKAKELAKAIEDQKDSKDLKKAAKALKLDVKNSTPLTKDGTIPSLVALKELDPKILTLPVGAVGGPVDVLAGRQVVYQVASREPAKEEEFAARKEQIRNRLLNEKRRIAFEVYQDNLRKKLQASGGLKRHEDVIARLTQPVGGIPKP